MGHRHCHWRTPTLFCRPGRYLCAQSEDVETLLLAQNSVLLVVVFPKPVFLESLSRNWMRITMKTKEEEVFWNPSCKGMRASSFILFSSPRLCNISDDTASRVKPLMYSILGNLGFFGILIFASVSLPPGPFPALLQPNIATTVTNASFLLFLMQVPNPLFDLAGITCGHFLVPFCTFFGATLIGKAFIKAHIQVHIPPSRRLGRWLSR